MGRVAQRWSGACGMVILLAGALGAGGLATAVEVGEKAPAFTLPSTMGGTVSLSQFQGKRLVLLEFYGADFTPV